MVKDICIKSVLEALKVFPNGLTVAELQQLTGRTGGDVTKAVSDLLKRQEPITKAYVNNPYTKLRTVRYMWKDRAAA